MDAETLPTDATDTLDFTYTQPWRWQYIRLTGTWLWPRVSPRPSVGSHGSSLKPSMSGRLLSGRLLTRTVTPL